MRHKKTIKLVGAVFLIVSALEGCGGGGGGSNINNLVRPGSELSIFNYRGKGQFPFAVNAHQAQIERDNATSATLGPDVGSIVIAPGGKWDGIGIELPASFMSALSTPRTAQFLTSERIDPMGGTFDTFVQGSVASGSTSTFTLLNTDFGGTGLDYTTYGIWEYNTYDGMGTLLTTRATAATFGFPTEVKNMPTTGMATYNGRMDGRYSDSLAPNQVVNGNLSMTADFQTTNVSVNMTGVTLDGLSFRDLSGTGNITNNTFVDKKNKPIGGFIGTITTDPIQPGQIGPDMNGSLQGSFYGPTANEVGGVFEMEGGSAVMNGAFVGSQ